MVSPSDVVEGTLAAYTFELFNPTALAIRVSKVESTCGCTVADLEAGQQIAPGERLPLTIQMDTIGRAGNLEQIVTVYTDGTAEPLKIPVKAKVRRELVLENEPRQIEARKGEHVEKTFVARWITPGKYEITGADSRDGHVSATVQPLKRLETEQVPARWRELGVPGAVDSARPLDPLAWKKYFLGLNQRLGKGKASPEDVAIVTHYLQKNGAHPEFRAWFAMVLADFSRSKYVPALIPVARMLLKDPDEGIRSMAAEALGASVTRRALRQCCRC